MAELRITVNGRGRSGSGTQTIGSLSIGAWMLSYDFLSPQPVSPSNYFWTILRLVEASEPLRTAGGRAVRVTLTGTGNRRTVSVDLGTETGFRMVAGETDIPIASHGTVAANLEITGWLFRARTAGGAYGGAMEEEEVLQM